jgi:DNA replication and repair protein RecF
VIEARRRYLAELTPRFAQAYEAITHSGVQATAAYAVSHDEDAHPTLAEALAASRGRDVARRQTHVGPHVDDVELRLGGRSARAFASQGQLRALVLAWKTAEMRLLREVHGDAPVLLLDDVSSELDPQRNQFLFGFLRELACQCFVTTTHPSHVLVSENRLDFQVVEGKVGP